MINTMVAKERSPLARFAIFIGGGRIHYGRPPVKTVSSSHGPYITKLLAEVLFETQNKWADQGTEVCWRASGGLRWSLHLQLQVSLQTVKHGLTSTTVL